MVHHSSQITPLIHENLWTVLTYALSDHMLEGIIAQHFKRDPLPYLQKSRGQIATLKAERALLEMATQLRILDNELDLTSFEKTKSLGQLLMKDGQTEELSLREMTNKIIHSAEFRWRFDPQAPKAVCYANDKEIEKYDWVTAEIDLIS